ncbi:ABC transporter permease [Microbacterium sp. NPDC055357]
MTLDIAPVPAGAGAGESTVAVRTRVRRGSGAWPRYIAGRLLSSVMVLVALALLAFLVVRLVPGDPAVAVLGLNATPDQLERVREQLGLNLPWYSQLLDYFGGLLTGDLGQSFRTNMPVADMIGQRLPVTAALTFGGVIVVLVFGIPLGLAVGMAQARRSREGGVFSAAMSFVGAIPEYIMGTALILVLGLWLRVLPIQGGGGIAGYIMPSLAVGLAAAAVMARIVRNETRSVMTQEYMMAARAKRLPQRRLVLFHVLPNVVTSSLTLGGLLIISLLGGAVITENVFNLPGLGTEVVQAISKSDYPTIQGIILTLGVLAVLTTLVIDVILGILDPRVMQKRGL